MSSADWLASVGVFLSLVAFFFNVLGVFGARSRPYQVLNLLGAGLSCYGAWLIRFFPFVVLEGVWSFVALVTLVRTLVIT